MALTKVSSGLISADASSVDLNIDAGTLYIDATNNRVGIGTTSPTQPLHVYHATTNGVANFQSGDTGVNISLMDSATTAANYVGIGALGNELTFIAGNGAEKMRIDSSGRVGIGTSSPTGNLVVVNSGGGGLNIGYNATSTNYYDADTQIFRNGSFAEKMRIDSSGNLGLGTTSPKNLSGQNSITINGSVARIDFKIADTFKHAIVTESEYLALSIDPDNTQGNSRLAVLVDNTERMRIDSSGNVGINTSSTIANAILNVDGGINTTTGIIGTLTSDSFTFNGQTNPHYGINFNPTGSRPVGISGYAGIAFATSGTERMRMPTGGGICLGVGSHISNTETEGTFLSAGVDGCPTLDIAKVSGTTSSSAYFIRFHASSGGTSMGAIAGNGSANVQFVALSDERLKENIQPLSGSLDKVLALNPVSYDWKENGEHIEAGFVAQEVEQVLPEYVTTEDDEDQTKGLTGGMTAGYIAVLTKAIQEQQTLIEQLQAEVALLKGE